MKEMERYIRIRLADVSGEKRTRLVSAQYNATLSLARHGYQSIYITNLYTL